SPTRAASSNNACSWTVAPARSSGSSGASAVGVMGLTSGRGDGDDSPPYSAAPVFPFALLPCDRAEEIIGGSCEPARLLQPETPHAPGDLAVCGVSGPALRHRVGTG